MNVDSLLFFSYAEIAACCWIVCRINITYAKLWWPYGNLKVEQQIVCHELLLSTLTVMWCLGFFFFVLFISNLNMKWVFWFEAFGERWQCFSDWVMFNSTFTYYGYDVFGMKYSNYFRYSWLRCQISSVQKRKSNIC